MLLESEDFTLFSSFAFIVPVKSCCKSVKELYVFPLYINFKFVGSMGSAYRQVGNAVPVLLSKLLGEKILDCLNMKS